jgi:hypothetical protein
MSFPENVAVIHSVILDDLRISTKTDSGDPGDILGKNMPYFHLILDMTKLLPKRVPKCPNADEKRDEMLASQAILD